MKEGLRLCSDKHRWGFVKQNPSRFQCLLLPGSVTQLLPSWQHKQPVTREWITSWQKQETKKSALKSVEISIRRRLENQTHWECVCLDCEWAASITSVQHEGLIRCGQHDLSIFHRPHTHTHTYSLKNIAQSHRHNKHTHMQPNKPCRCTYRQTDLMGLT